jgi:hypothetical protein
MKKPGRSEAWRKSSYSSNTESCVEVNTAVVPVGVRDTKDRAGGELAVLCTAWRALLDELARD